MPPLVSPRQVALALGVSESSLKRWCDAGLIESVRTAGGHRRISRASVVRFLKQTGQPLARPELLSLPASTSRAEYALADARVRLRDALLAGEEDACRRIVLELHLAGHPAYVICDQVLASAFAEIGDRWSCGEAQIYQERRACEQCARVIDELRALCAPPRRPSLAVGGTPECDPYTLPTAMVELVLRQAGWRAQSLGSRLPWDTMVAAVHDLNPQLFWLSVSHLDDEARFLEEYRAFCERVRASTVLVVGGRALTESVRRQMEYAAHCDTLQHLDSFVRSWPSEQMPRTSSSKRGRTGRRKATEGTK